MHAKAAAKLLKADPTRTNEGIAAELGCHRDTVQIARKALEEKGDIPKQPKAPRGRAPAVRDRRLYRADYPTFEDYCRRRRGLVAAGKPKMAAVGACMRKLVMICYGVLKTLLRTSSGAQNSLEIGVFASRRPAARPRCGCPTRRIP